MGVFKAGTQAGKYEDAVQVTVQYGDKVETQSVEVVVTPGPLFTLVPTPESITTEVGTGQQLRAQGTDAFGNEIADLQLTWQVLNSESGTVSEKGLFNAGTKVGVYSKAVQVAGEYHGGSKTASIAVVIAPGPVKSVSLRPAISNKFFLSAGQSIKFWVVATDAHGNSVPDPLVAWSAQGGTVTTTGTFTAGKGSPIAVKAAMVSSRPSRGS